MSWTVENEFLLRKLWADGLSASMIAAEIPGATRNAILGKAFRLGLPPHATIISHPFGPKPRGPTDAQRITRVERMVAQRKAMKEKALQKPEPEPIPEVKDSLNIPLLDLDPDQCRYATSDAPFLFCGHPVMHESYCAAHHRICYNHNSQSVFVPARVSVKTESAGRGD